VLVAEDDPVSRRVLEVTLRKWGFDVVACADGEAAMEGLVQPDAPRLAILDWMMPGLEGPEICRRLRVLPAASPSYVILLTARVRKEDLIEGLRAGADDYVTKPFDREELYARLQVGVRVLSLQQQLAERVEELQSALAEVKQLSGMLPICCYCKKIRDDKDYWMQVEEYIGERSGAEFTHGICPDCLERILD
jgi:DNA-binding response OmpR family regulator